MKKFFTCLFSMGSAISVFAQPQITSANMPLVGDSYTYLSSDAAFTPATFDAMAGANQTWDLSGFQSSGSMTAVAINPAGTPFAASFPNANVVIEIEGEYTYLNSGASQLALLGAGAEIEGDQFLVQFSDPEILYNLPVTFQSTMSDTYSGTGEIFETPYDFNGTTSYTVDGWGSLTLPSGTFPNCIRYKGTKSETLTIMEFPLTTTTTRWAWLSADHRYVVAMFDMTTAFGESSYSGMVINTPVTTVSEQSSSRDAHVYPNPLTRNSAPVLEWAKSEMADVVLFNFLGQVVYSDRMPLAAGPNVLSAVIGNQPAGTYVLQITGADGAVTPLRISIQ